MGKPLSLIILSLLFPGFVQAATEDLNIITAQGFGTVDSSRFSKPQAKLLARRAAIVEAQRNLVEVIDGVRITAGTTVKDMMLESDIIGSRVKGMVRGAFIVSESVTEDEGSWVAEVELAVCLNAAPEKCRKQPSLASLVQPELAKPKEEDMFVGETAVIPDKARASGLIIDVSRKNFAPMLDVRVRTADGKEVYGPGHVSEGTDWLHWANSLSKAADMHEIVGSQPLVIIASDIGPNDEVLLSQDAAEQIYRQTSSTDNFLKQGKVIFVVK